MSTAQEITPELRAWIVQQAQAGHAPETVLASMRASGWDEDIAIEALEQTLRGFLASHAKAQTLPPPVPVPEPNLAGSPSTIEVEGHPVRIVMAMRSPRIIVFGNLLSDSECDEMVELARDRLARSETVVNATGASEVNAARTSEGMFFTRGEFSICQRIEARIAALLRWPLVNGEGLQVLRYRPGAEYKPHHDYFDPAHAGSVPILKRGGQRVASLVMYLSTPRKGGATTFPDIQLEVAPLKGQAVFFSYDKPHASTRTLHGGAPVVEGEKWVATKWLREGRFE